MCVYLFKKKILVVVVLWLSQHIIYELNTFFSLFFPPHSRYYIISMALNQTWWGQMHIRFYEQSMSTPVVKLAVKKSLVSYESLRLVKILWVLSVL